MMLDKNKSVSCSIYFMSALYMMIMSVNAILANKLIQTPLGVFSAASIISPIWFILGDIIAEVYGYKTSRTLFWSVTLCQILFSLLCYFILKLPSPNFWNGQASYYFVTGSLFKIAIFALLGNLIAWKINIFFLLKWKILMRGKYFFLRSIGSSGIGEILFSLLSIFPVIVSTMPLHDVWTVIIFSCILKLIGLAVLSPIATFIVKLLYVMEGFNKSQKLNNINPLMAI